VWNNASKNQAQHDSVVAPLSQDLLELGIAKVKEAQGGVARGFLLSLRLLRVGREEALFAHDLLCLFVTGQAEKPVDRAGRR
jgi:hypothetical protein